MTETRIQIARAILKGWQEGALLGPWSKEADTDWEGTKQAAITTVEGPLTWDNHGGDVFSPGTARLIVGTAGNPAFLEAVDGMLAQVELVRHVCPAVVVAYAETVADSIIQAEERMAASWHGLNQDEQNARDVAEGAQR